MTDWATISSLATAGGTLVLASATFASIRSANRAARIAEQALLSGRRPLLTQTRPEDPPTRVSWVDGHWISIDPGLAAVDLTDAAIYLAFSVRNSGSGVAVIHGWLYGAARPGEAITEVNPGDFIRQSRDLYIAASEVGFWQGALRDPASPVFDDVAGSIRARSLFTIDVLYGDDEGGQRMISRFSIQPKQDGGWSCVSNHHRHVDRADPRQR